MPRQALYITTTRWYNANVQYGLEFLQACRDALGLEIAVAAPQGYPILERADQRGIQTLACEKGTLAFPRSLKARLAEFPDALLIAGDSSAQNHLLAVRGRRKLVRIRIDARPLETGPINRAIYRRLDGLALPSAPDRSRLAQRLGWPESKIFVHPGSADRLEDTRAEDGAAFRQAHGISPDAFALGLLGRLDTVKGHRVALDALKIALDTAPNLHLILAGKEANLTVREVEGWIAQRNLQRKVALAGFLPSTGPAIAASNAGLIASVGSEPQSRVMIEWALHDKPILSSQVGICAEWGPRLGPSVPPNDARALAREMVRLAQSPKEVEEGRERVGAIAGRFQRESWNSEVGKWIQSVVLNP